MSARAPALREVQDRPFPFADAEVVDLREVLQQDPAQGGCVDIAEDDLQVWPPDLENDGEVQRVQKPGGGGGEPDEFRIGVENGGCVRLDPRRGARAEAVVDGGRMAVFFQPGGKRENPDRRHAVGQHGEIRLAGHEIESGGMNERDAHDGVAGPVGAGGACWWAAPARQAIQPGGFKTVEK